MRNQSGRLEWGIRQLGIKHSSQASQLMKWEKEDFWRLKLATLIRVNSRQGILTQNLDFNTTHKTSHRDLNRATFNLVASYIKRQSSHWKKKTWALFFGVTQKFRFKAIESKTQICKSLRGTKSLTFPSEIKVNLLSTCPQDQSRRGLLPSHKRGPQNVYFANSKKKLEHTNWTLQQISTPKEARCSNHGGILWENAKTSGTWGPRTFTTQALKFSTMLI